MRAVAVTDHANMFGAIRHYAASKAAGVQPILGCEVNVVRPSGNGVVDHAGPARCRSRRLPNLIRLGSLGYRRPRASRRRASRSIPWPSSTPQGSSASTGCLAGLFRSRCSNMASTAPPTFWADCVTHSARASLRRASRTMGLPEQRVLNDLLTANGPGHFSLPSWRPTTCTSMDRDDGEAQLFLECVRLDEPMPKVQPTHHAASRCT